MNEELGDVDASRASVTKCNFTDAISDLSQKEKIHYMEQVILDLMDYTEQSDEEHLWCDLLVEFKRLIEKYENSI